MNGTKSIALYAKELKLPTFVDYQTVIRQATENGWGYEEFLWQMLAREAAKRRENQITRLIKRARFPLKKTLDEFKFEHLPYLEEALVSQLATGSFIEKRENIVMIGNPGTGKTHLSIALGLAGCYRGYSARFFTAAELVTKLTEARDEHRMGRLTREIAKTNLLIVDELSYVSFPRHSAELLFQVISERSERGSVIINTNLDFSKWDQIFSDHMLAAALVDRVTFKSHILNMNGDSYRLKHR